MTFAATKGITISQAFEAFDRANPQVYEAFKAQLRLAVKAGKKKVSAKTLLGVVRWNVWIQTEGDEFKINDAFTALYARKFVEEFPAYSYIFNLRERRSA